LIPRLHLVTDDAVLQQDNFIPLATELLLVLQRRAALHIRARHVSAAALFALVSELKPRADTVGALLAVNDRVDVALTASARAVQLGTGSLPVATVRAMGGPRLAIGYSAHAADEAAAAERDGADFVFAGSIYDTASHPLITPAGLTLLVACVGRCSIPVLAIGGVTAERVPDVLRTGAYGAAVIRAVWHARDPVQAADELAKLLEE
jgi:thiamine-phosphate pyrophosphorylase